MFTKKTFIAITDTREIPGKGFQSLKMKTGR